MEKQQKINWRIYLRLLSFVKPYKTRLFIGIFFGFVTGGSMFGMLTQISTVMDNVIAEQDHSQTVSSFVVQGADDHKFEVTRNISNDDKIEESIKLGDSYEVIELQTIDAKKRQEWDSKVAKIPEFIRSFIENTLGMPLQNKVTGEPTGAIIVMASFLLVIAVFFKSLGTFMNRYYMRWVGLRVVTDLRSKLFTKLTNQSMEFHNSEEVGVMMSRVQNDTGTIQSAISENIGQMTRSPIEVLSVIGFVVWFSMKNGMGHIVLFIIIGLPLCIAPLVLIGKKLKKYAKKTMGQIAIVMGKMQEVLSCVRLVKAYNMEKYEQDLFEDKNNKFFKYTMRSKVYDLMMNPVTEFCGVILILGFLLYAINNGMGIDKILAIGLAANLAYKPFKSLTKIQSNMIKSIVAAERIFEYLDMDYEIPEKPEAKKSTKFHEGISFEKVGFSYAGQKTLNNIDLKIKKGQFVAFVGEAGSGKTTIVNMLARFYDIHEGAIKIDGVDIRDLSNESLRSLIGFVDQVTTLFNDTVKYNISYGMQGASDEELMEAAAKAEVSSFVDEKDQGYEFNVGAGGNKLSGGQRQRVAIARAILSNPPILILDEATSALDNVTEQLVQKAINELMQDRTVIAIAHRLSTVKSADCIYVLSKGEIVESGSHDELLAQEGYYTRLWDTQFKEGR